MNRIDEEKWERIQIISDRAERIKEMVPSEEFDPETARIIARAELEGRMARYKSEDLA